jgi:hypothetical protein
MKYLKLFEKYSEFLDVEDNKNQNGMLTNEILKNI